MLEVVKLLVVQPALVLAGVLLVADTLKLADNPLPRHLNLVAELAIELSDSRVQQSLVIQRVSVSLEIRHATDLSSL